jgi:hypothetical protein
MRSAGTTPEALFVWLSLTLAVTPLYTVVPWWDLLTHALVSAAITVFLYRHTGVWWLSLFVLLSLGLLWEWVEYARLLSITLPSTLRDTLSDLSMELGAWLAVRAAVYWRSSAEKGLDPGYSSSNAK